MSLACADPALAERLVRWLRGPPGAPPRVVRGGEPAERAVDALAALLARRPGLLAAPDRLRVGSELCERRIPSPAALRAARTLAARLGLGIEYATGVVTDDGLRRHLRNVRTLHRAGVLAEVIVNDWGVIETLRRLLPAVRPVLGRLLVKHARSPRTAWSGPRPVGVAGDLRALRRRQRAAFLAPDVGSPRYARWLRRRGVREVETDPVAGALALPQDLGLSFRLHLPWAVVATGRCCPAASLRLPGAERVGAGGDCGRECRGWCTVETPPGGPPLWQRGNTLFQDHGHALASRLASGSWTRVVFSVGPPD
jgi:hypothetical protein